MIRREVVGGAVGIVAGLLLGWGLWRPTASSVDPPAPPLRQGDGSLVLERTAPTKEPPPHEIPKGGREERRVSVVVQPPRGVVVHPTTKDSLVVPDHPVGSHDMVDHVADSGKMIDSCDCPPVQVDLSLVRLPDKTRRVVASSPTGEILTGVDIPFEEPALPRIPRWTLSAIAVADLDGVRPGAMLSRRIGPFVVGGGVLTDPGLRRPGAIAQFGVTW